MTYVVHNYLWFETVTYNISYIEMFIFKKTDSCYFFAQGLFGMSALALELLRRTGMFYGHRVMTRDIP